MAPENVEIVRKLFEAYNRGDYAEAVTYLAHDVVWGVGQEVPARGPDAVLALWERWESDWEDLQTVPEEYIESGDRVFVAVHYTGRGRGSGVEFDDRLFDVYTVRYGKCVCKLEFRERADALEAAGLSE